MVTFLEIVQRRNIGSILPSIIFMFGEGGGAGVEKFPWVFWKTLIKIYIIIVVIVVVVVAIQALWSPRYLYLYQCKKFFKIFYF